MPISVKCECGRSMKVKDELAGKRGKCPSCGQVLLIPALDVLPEVEDPPARRPRDEEDDPAPRRKRKGEAAYSVADTAEDEPRPRRESQRPREDDEEDARPPRRERRRRDRQPERARGGGFGTSSAGVLGGVLMMLIAVVWFIAGLAANRIYIYPPILFVLGLISLVKGLTGQD